jgi:hypothetical protein
MANLPDLQQRFLNYLLHADDSIANDIVGGSHDERARRLSIYFNAYRIRLRGSIEIDHPVLGVYLGDDGFETLASAYIAKHRSANTSLRHFCDQLPEFLRTEPPFADILVLSEIARFERALMDVFDAADAQVIDMSALSDIPAEQWPELTLQLHPSFRCFVTEWNCVEIWRAIKAERTPPDAVCADKQAWLLWRNTDRLSEFRSVSVDEYEVLRTAAEGGTFAVLCEVLLEWHSPEDVASRAWSLLGKWVDSGLITATNA